MQNRSVKDPLNICASHESKVKRDEKRVDLSPPHTLYLYEVARIDSPEISGGSSTPNPASAVHLTTISVARPRTPLLPRISSVLLLRFWGGPTAQCHPR
jgi:hypothetical protein